MDAPPIFGSRSYRAYRIWGKGAAPGLAGFARDRAFVAGVYLLGLVPDRGVAG